jgi:hypothetical protein
VKNTSLYSLILLIFTSLILSCADNKTKKGNKIFPEQGDVENKTYNKLSMQKDFSLLISTPKCDLKNNLATVQVYEADLLFDNEKSKSKRCLEELNKPTCHQSFSLHTYVYIDTINKGLIFLSSEAKYEKNTMWRSKNIKYRKKARLVKDYKIKDHQVNFSKKSFISTDPGSFKYTIKLNHTEEESLSKVEEPLELSLKENPTFFNMVCDIQP